MKRKEANEKGLKTYSTGVPCSKGHLAPRYTASGACSLCVQGYQKSFKRSAVEKAFKIVTVPIKAHVDDVELIVAYAAALAFGRQAKRSQDISDTLARGNF